jgi:hypothetical protein
MNSTKRLSIVPLLFLFACGSSDHSGHVDVDYAQTALQGGAAESHVEDIFLIRSVRVSVNALPNDVCTPSVTGFGSIVADQNFEFFSVAARQSDGMIVNPEVHKLGTGRGCFGLTADPNVANFYGITNFDTLSSISIGTVNRGPTNFPAPGLTESWVKAQVVSATNGYFGGLFTANSIASLNTFGDETNPPGYVQSSIATLRLWRHPQ